MKGFRGSGLTRFAAALALVVSAGSPVRGEDCCDPAGPFAPGEAYAAQPATCETIAYWMERAPETQSRISLTITGELAAVASDGALAYLVMCDPAGVQVMCVTYSLNGMEQGDAVLFAGGYARVGDMRIMLDPCLASFE